MISFIYANRNRDKERINLSLKSLSKQRDGEFEVVFVDYGSELSLVQEYEHLFKNFSFVRFFSLEVLQLLWNKSKALNYGIKKAKGSFIFIADVDLIFHPNTIGFLYSIAVPEKFFLFSLNYLDMRESGKLENSNIFSDLKPKRKGKVNGMILVSTPALKEVWGLDEFFHFYGGEDEDLFARLESAGYERKLCDTDYFLHQWHPSFSGSEKELLTITPRVKNIMRINQRHFLQNLEEKRTRPLRQTNWGEIISPEERVKLLTPTKKIKLPNIRAWVEHFLREELVSLKGEIVAVTFFEDPYYLSGKHKIKKLLRMQTQPYCTMKEVNDMVLKSILFNYRGSNYSYRIGEDLKHIYFSIAL